MASARPSSSEDEVLILLATFNGQRYLREQLASIAAQTHRHWRLLIADDGSSDQTCALIRAFAKEQFGRVRLLTHDPVGSARDNFFRLIRAADAAPYYALCDQDDVWLPSKLESLVAECRRQESAASATPMLVYSDVSVVDAKLAVVNPSFLRQIRADPQAINFRSLLVENAIPGCAMLLNSALMKLVQSADFDSNRAIMHDWWIALLASTLGRLSYVPEQLTLYRQHEANAMGSVERSGLRLAISKLVKGSRAATIETYAQASEFLSAYGHHLDPATHEAISAFGSLQTRGKIARIRTLAKYRIFKQTLGRRAYQLLRA
jgi:glycosyltransferase involved in cell wall biosynthesis